MTGRSALLEITALEPLILTADAATEGAPATLDHVPGAVLLGLAAQRCYETVSDPYRVFHSGAVRFGCGLPLSPRDGAPGAPAPFSLHVVKPNAFLDEEGRLARDVVDLSRRDRDPDQQYQQFRTGWLPADRRAFEIAVDGGLKTAIDATTGRAAEGQLYGYAAIRPGARFLARLLDDGDAATGAADDFKTVLAALTKCGRIGRSRHTEFGRIAIKRLEGEDPLAPALARGDVRERHVLLALSDVHLPLDPRTGELDLLMKGAALDPEHSFARARRYSPFNGAWRRRGVERMVLVAGSVIALETANPDRLARIETQGWGLDREAGLGQVAVDPAILDGVVTTPETAAAPRPAAPRPEPTPFYAAIRARATADEADLAARAAAEEMIGALEALYRGAAQVQAAPVGSVGPSKSQWGEVAQILGAPDWRGELDKILGATTDRTPDPDWHARTGSGRSFRDWIEDGLGDGPPGAAFRIATSRARDVIERLAREADRGRTRE